MEKKVLIVDDEKDTVTFLEKGLQREGFKVITAFDGLEAKEKILKEDPGLILLDLMMPKLDGWGVLKWMREEAKLSIPTIIVSVKGEMEDLRKGTLEADTYLVKPITVEDVVKAINVVSSLEIGEGTY